MRLRHAAVPPIAAFLFAHIYYSSRPLFPGLPWWSFYIVIAATGLGAVAGLVLIVRVVRAERLRGVAIGWLIAALIAVYLSASTFLTLSFPWL